MMNSGNSDCKCYFLLVHLDHCLNDFNSGCVCRAAFFPAHTVHGISVCCREFSEAMGHELGLGGIARGGDGGT